MNNLLQYSKKDLQMSTYKNVEQYSTMLNNLVPALPGKIFVTMRLQLFHSVHILQYWIQYMQLLIQGLSCSNAVQVGHALSAAGARAQWQPRRRRRGYRLRTPTVTVTAWLTRSDLDSDHDGDLPL